MSDEGGLFGLIDSMQKTANITNLLALANGIIQLREALEKNTYLTRREKKILRKVLNQIEDYLETNT